MQDVERHTVDTASATEIHPDRLYAVGGAEPVDSRVWLPASARGWLPFNSYVVRSATDALIVDTGVAAHEQEIRAGLTEVLDGTSTRAITFTRYEPDTLINLPWIVRDFAIDTVIGGGRSGGVKPLDFFDAFDVANSAAIVETFSGRRVELVARGKTVESGEISLESGPTPLFVLETFWLYDPVTCSLFSSDSWAFVTMPAKDGDRVVTDESELTEERIREHLTGPRFNWLVACDHKRVITELEAIMTDHVVDRICPATGRIIEGRDLVEQVFERTIAVVDRLSHTPYTDTVPAWIEKRRARIERDGKGGEAPPSPVEGYPSAPTGEFPRLVSPTLLWTAGCLPIKYADSIVHGHFNVFLIRGSEKTLLVDTGHPAYPDVVMSSVKEFLDGDPLDYIFPTHNEMAHAGLLPHWMRLYPDAKMVGDTRDYHLLYPGIEDRLMRLEPGDAVDLGDREFEIVPAIWRDLPTQWGFDTKERVLFTGDGYAYLHYPFHERGLCDLMTSEQPLPDVGLISFFNQRALKWTVYKDASQTFDSVDAVLAELQPRLVAPAHSGIVDAEPEAILGLVKQGMLSGD